MGGVFSGSSKSKKPGAAAAAPGGGSITDIDRAILDLKNSRDRLTKYNLQLESSIQKLLERARRAKETGHSQTALGLLRLKKYKQTQVENVQTQLLNVHQLVETIDSQQRNAQIVQSLKAGKDALAKLHEETSVEDVLNLMDEVAEQNQVEREINDILQGAVPSLSVEEEQAVEAELAAMQADLEGTAATTTTTTTTDEEEAVPDMPVEPHTKLPEIQKQQEPAKAQPKKQPDRVPLAG